MEKLNRPPGLPKTKMEKWHVFALRAALSFIWREGGLLFHFILPRPCGESKDSVLKYFDLLSNSPSWLSKEMG